MQKDARGGIRNLQVLHMSRIPELAIEETQTQEDRNISTYPSSAKSNGSRRSSLQQFSISPTQPPPKKDRAVAKARPYQR